MWKWIFGKLFADVDPGIPTERALELAHDSVSGQMKVSAYHHGINAALAALSIDTVDYKKRVEMAISLLESAQREVAKIE